MDDVPREGLDVVDNGIVAFVVQVIDLLDKLAIQLRRPNHLAGLGERLVVGKLTPVIVVLEDLADLQ